MATKKIVFTTVFIICTILASWVWTNNDSDLTQAALIRYFEELSS